MMLLTRFCFYAALAAACVGQVAAYPLTITLPSPSVNGPPAAFPAIPGGLLGQWRDGSCLLLPSGITPFETVSDTLDFHAGGTFSQTIETATGTLHEQGRYTVTGSRLTLDYLFDTRKPAQYEFARNGDHLLLQPVGHGKMAAWTLQRVGEGINSSMPPALLRIC